MKKFYEVLVNSSVLCAWLFFVSISTAEEFHNPTHGYNISIPDDWVEIPPGVIEDLSTRAFKQDAKPALSYDAGFQLRTADRWLQYPFVLIQAIPYSTYGIKRQISESEFPELTRAMTGIEIGKIIDKTISPEARPYIDEVELEQPILDAANRRYLLSVELHIQGVGPVRGLAAGYFGREGVGKEKGTSTITTAGGWG